MGRPRITELPKRARERHLLRWAAGLSTLEVIEASKRGLRGKELGQIQEETNFSNQDWSNFLQCNLRTIQRYRRTNSLIDPSSSERVLLMAQIVEHGREVFGGDSRFQIWLNSPSQALANRTPLQLLDTTTGMSMVKAELSRIDHGIY
jgi:putative toxin-antitoxin system antitoxin component (TIGR02293 family)